MRIIFLEAVHNFGGSSKSTLELAQRLINDGHEILIVDFWGSCRPYVEECQKENVPLKIIDKREKPILLKVENKFNTAINYVNYLKTIRLYKKRMLQIIDEFEPELISVNNTKTLSILSSSEQYKIAYFARGWFLPKTLSSLTKRLLKKKTDIFLTVSQATKQMVYSGGFAELPDIYVVHNAIDFALIQKHLPLKNKTSFWHLSDERDFVMMHCGTFIETKGQHIAVEVVKKLRDKKINVKLLLVGLIAQSEVSKNYHADIEKIVKDYGLQDSIDFVINKSDVLGYYVKSDLLIHPSYTEGLPRVVLESMAFGNPVVGNAVGGMTDFISNNYTGFLTNFNVVDEYVEYIEMLINDKEKYKFIAENASNLIKFNYTIENQINAFKKIKL